MHAFFRPPSATVITNTAGTSTVLRRLVVLMLVLFRLSTPVYAFSSSSSSPSPFDGSYKLVELYDEESNPVVLVDGPSYECSISSDNNNNDNNLLQFNLKFGNSFFATITILEQESYNDANNATIVCAKIQMGPVAGTKMMPPEPIWRVEMAFASIVSTFDSMELLDDGQLILKATSEEATTTRGKIVLEPSE